MGSRYNCWKSEKQVEVSFYPPYGEEGGSPTYLENTETLPIEKVAKCPDSTEEPNCDRGNIRYVFE